MVCDGCGRDEAACTCAAAGLLDFLSDFQGRPKRHFVPVGSNGTHLEGGPAGSGSAGFEASGPTGFEASGPAGSGSAVLEASGPAGSESAGFAGLPGAEPLPVGSWMDEIPSGVGLYSSGDIDANACPTVPRAGSPVPLPGQAPAHHLPPAAASHGRLPGASLLDFSGGNTLATASVVLASLSLLMPLLAIAGVAAGIVTLQREKEAPWMRGRARAVAAIVLSLVLAPVSLAIWISILTGS